MNPARLSVMPGPMSSALSPVIWEPEFPNSWPPPQMGSKTWARWPQAVLIFVCLFPFVSSDLADSQETPYFLLAKRREEGTGRQMSNPNPRMIYFACGTESTC